MEGYEVIVELKTGRRHRGRLTSADDNMNLMLEEAGDDDKDEHENKGKTMDMPRIPIRNIRGSSVRYVHFPDNADLTALVRSGRERERNAARRYQKTKRKSSG
uniref:Sm domain-containing protein n=1 Tax=Pseudo-nitzschia australis TaxID=44445 RepID=A0A7S4AM83_9STRA|mmetsp:Transcript_25517/g.53758  ORF Transcript_25517/g.53758 Transcript_25517/m.53758 type:complete len:103 (-) Transcript_25517:366-674(-)